MKILVIEDEQELRDIIRESLEKELYLVEVASNYKVGIEKLAGYDYDCILLDIMLPDGNGIDLLREIKSMGKADSVIIISAKDSIDDKVLGLELGADDYLTKPFHLSELLARIKSVLRRKNQQGFQSVKWNNIEIFIDERTVVVQGSTILLNNKEFELLYYFVVNANRLVTKSSIAEHIWGDNMDEADSYDFVYSQVKNLRKKLKSHHAEVNIQSVYGMGYKLVNE
ncbi:response regulator transcription factor [Myroides odoratimimus]|uniref:Two-component system response regulator n=1 Tax=Myroides odoratimimus TaxID=76832 RepID=A0AAI8G6G4_9FLAO|nr:response regulator transcription factor [Myroides odoratimimus]ALU27771.1 two-component system response regulator [Myroides odoratimimus]MDM1059681.1 response regulator transcription factor [Myroides odoratimimus]MDM1085630.1 response regulator transcription factor [Myroides odoratimimus]WHT73358.1 response regulator transcription factor [Myroides odoratimimus]WHU37940.1 response regulator transcription factor [Myroides odoratimimus]